ncbi:hypothetical protein NHH03_12650 [Stieleria sp. TO1_6]|uniref:hypothetical protein n=1 Tax=Stieleria tagensis TaxID=2956795 RepID=UPI00209B448D|nr:hypothetical protein [Stieleria tagensis]MCO8122588.1 hypothetical protein [Stieleria tagensis]
MTSGFDVNEGDKGILYVAIGARMRQSLVRSIESVRKHLDFPFRLATDLADAADVDQVVVVEAVKPAFVPRLPCARTHYLDTDSVILHSDAAKPLTDRSSDRSSNFRVV